jgi:outer membrane protein assembly factor BamB
LYCFPGGLEKNAAALNRFTGETIWTSRAMSDSVSFCSPLIINLASRKILVNFTAKYIVGLDANTGDLLWSQKQENVKQNQQCATPIFADGNIYYISGVGNGAVKLELSHDGKSIQEIWRIRNSRNGLNSPVKINDFLYFTDTRQKLKCIDINQGIVVDSLRITRGPLAFADNMFYCYSENGQVSLIKVAGSKMEIVSKYKIENGTREHLACPLIDKGILYIRHGKALMAYDISTPE